MMHLCPWAWQGTICVQYQTGSSTAKPKETSLVYSRAGSVFEVRPLIIATLITITIGNTSTSQFYLLHNRASHLGEVLSFAICCIISTTTLWDSQYQSHFTDEKTGSERLGNFPKVTWLVTGWGIQGNLAHSTFSPSHFCITTSIIENRKIINFTIQAPLKLSSKHSKTWRQKGWGGASLYGLYVVSSCVSSSSCAESSVSGP